MKAVFWWIKQLAGAIFIGWSMMIAFLIAALGGLMIFRMMVFFLESLI